MFLYSSHYFAASRWVCSRGHPPPPPVIVYMPVNLNTYCIANSINSIRSKPFDTPRPRLLQMNRTGASQVFLWFEPPLSANHWVSTECVRTDFVSMVRTGATMHQNNYQAAKLTWLYHGPLVWHLTKDYDRCLQDYPYAFRWPTSSLVLTWQFTECGLSFSAEKYSVLVNIQHSS